MPSHRLQAWKSTALVSAQAGARPNLPSSPSSCSTRSRTDSSGSESYLGRSSPLTSEGSFGAPSEPREGPPLPLSLFASLNAPLALPQADAKAASLKNSRLKSKEREEEYWRLANSKNLPTISVSTGFNIQTAFRIASLT